ncbi:Hypothetical_protein [Hexamita inflata]|uniref:Hypothetical_protein n=1 Tax=Hexamita inflata TaxID=28002 RepID=A0ABP1GI29_9EUKA
MNTYDEMVIQQKNNNQSLNNSATVQKLVQPERINQNSGKRIVPQQNNEIANQQEAKQQVKEVKQQKLTDTPIKVNVNSNQITSKIDTVEEIKPELSQDLLKQVKIQKPVTPDAKEEIIEKQVVKNKVIDNSDEIKKLKSDLELKTRFQTELQDQLGLLQQSLQIKSQFLTQNEELLKQIRLELHQKSMLVNELTQQLEIVQFEQTQTKQQLKDAIAKSASNQYQNQLQNELKVLRIQLNSQEQTYKLHDEKIQKLTGENYNLKNEKTNFQAEIKRLNTNINQLQITSHQQLSDANYQIEQQQALIKNLKEQVTKTNAESDVSRKNNEAKLSNMNYRYNQLEQKLQLELQKQAQENLETNNKYIQRIENLSKELNEEQIKGRKIIEENEKLKIEKENGEINTFQIRNKYQTDILKLKQDFEKEIAEIKLQHESKMQTNNNLLFKVKNMKSTAKMTPNEELFSIKVEFGKLEAANSSQETTIKQLMGVRTENEAKIQELEQQIQIRDQIIENNDASKLKEQLQQTKNLLYQEKQMNQQLRSQIQFAQQQAAKYQAMKEANKEIPNLLMQKAHMSSPNMHNEQQDKYVKQIQQKDNMIQQLKTKISAIECVNDGQPKSILKKQGGVY